MAGGSLIAMDAEQQRAANGQFGSGGGSSKGGPYEGEPGGPRSLYGQNVQHTEPKEGWAAYHKNKKAVAKDEDVPNAASMSGEAGRQARKLARDCNTGRFRP